MRLLIWLCIRLCMMRTGRGQDEKIVGDAVGRGWWDGCHTNLRNMSSMDMYTESLGLWFVCQNWLRPRGLVRSRSRSWGWCRRCFSSYFGFFWPNWVIQRILQQKDRIYSVGGYKVAISRKDGAPYHYIVYCYETEETLNQ